MKSLLPLSEIIKAIVYANDNYGYAKKYVAEYLKQLQPLADELHDKQIDFAKEFPAVHFDYVTMLNLQKRISA